jgi:hypothetical protein
MVLDLVEQLYNFRSPDGINLAAGDLFRVDQPLERLEPFPGRPELAVKVRVLVRPPLSPLN